MLFMYRQKPFYMLSLETATCLDHIFLRQLMRIKDLKIPKELGYYIPAGYI